MSKFVRLRVKSENSLTVSFVNFDYVAMFTKDEDSPGSVIIFPDGEVLHAENSVEDIRKQLLDIP